MKVKLFLDEDVHADLGQALRLRGYNAVHTQELECKGNSDAVQLSLAVDQERCLFTYNVKDFDILHNQYRQSQKDH
jgi:predicted nuclease of predicted toxin-antitoxin system